jgi:hypothetical protein
VDAHAPRSGGLRVLHHRQAVYTGTVTQEGLSLTSLKACVRAVSITLDRGEARRVDTHDPRHRKRSTDGRTLS